MKIKGKFEDNKIIIVENEGLDSREIPLGQNSILDIETNHTITKGAYVIKDHDLEDKILAIPNLLTPGDNVRVSLMSRGNFGLYLRVGQVVAELYELQKGEITENEVEKPVEKPVEKAEPQKTIEKTELQKAKVEEKTEPQKTIEKTEPQEKAKTEEKTQNKYESKNLDNIKNKFKDIA
jgi:outer membrane biosynthesis protein TonB